MSKNLLVLALCLTLFAFTGCAQNPAAPALSAEELQALDDSEFVDADVPGELAEHFESLGELASAAAYIVKAEVVSVEVEGGQTLTSVKLTDSFKGKLAKGDTIEIAEEGGTNGKIFGGTPQMSAPNVYYLFLTDEYNGKYYVTGAFGRFIVKEGYCVQQTIRAAKIYAYSPMQAKDFEDVVSG
ncbi:MAG: hypothetical protein LBN97_00375 [Oscillospiraceae bacterium]|jgi:hypothetical protein|nr:hypothetical protein [Oscillospiraceae bacterium]